MFHKELHVLEKHMVTGIVAQTHLDTTAPAISSVSSIVSPIIPKTYNGLGQAST